MTTKQELKKLLKQRFGFPGFRPNQEEVCLRVAEGADVLLVMPTGAGKSLCYQLPGLIREGTTLVISPLIALIEDQVAALQKWGLRAHRIHSGRSRGESNQVCKSYLDGELDYLYIAPERLSVPGFVELLARRKPGLIAVDEAHCISHWGHDFRPDYRLLGERLPALRPAPIVALTATATARVQDDIVTNLNLQDDERFIKGFWRHNLAAETRECPKPQRHDRVIDLLELEGSLPAIVYVSTRKETEELEGKLKDRFKTEIYHAGLEPDHRARSQSRFMAGEAEVVVATIAFGMGVDKPDIRTVIHTSLPDSMEVYYQEVGRAGRDGELARVYLLFGWADRRLLEFLHSRNYPPPGFLARILKEIPEQWTAMEDLQPRWTGADEEVQSALKQLYNHGAVGWTSDDRFKRLAGDKWRVTYRQQRSHRLAQIEDVLDFARSGRCRMNALVRHFSIREAGEKRCGFCDNCAPEDSRSRRFRQPTPQEERWMGDIVENLERRDGVSVGKLHGFMFPSARVDRPYFEALLDCLARAEMARTEEDAFEKDGRTITFQRVFLGRRSRPKGELWVEALK
jgi:DNA topoisomerase III